MEHAPAVVTFLSPIDGHVVEKASVYNGSAVMAGQLVLRLADRSTMWFEARVPEVMRGDEFLARYGGTTDPVTRVDPDRTYAVRQPAAHPIHEHHRVAASGSILRRAGARRDDERDDHRALVEEGAEAQLALVQVF